MRSNLFVILLSLSLLPACQPESIDLEATENGVALVGNQLITTDDVLQRMEELAAYRVSRHFNEEQKKSLLLEMVHFALIAQKAIDEGFKLSEPANKKRLVRDYLRKSIDQNPRLTPRPEEIRKVYEERKLELDRIRASHILISAAKQTDTEARVLAESILKRLKAGEDFAVLAKQFSADEATASKGGDLGTFSRTRRFVPAFLEASFNLKKLNELSPLVKTQFGYHIIKLTEDHRGLKNNRQFLLRQLNNEKRRAAYQNMLTRLKETTPIKVNYARLQGVNLALGIEAKQESRK